MMVETADLLGGTRSTQVEHRARGQRKFPYRFFIVTFAWSWILCLPLILAPHNFFLVRKELLANAAIPLLVLAVYGPAIGAIFSITTLEAPKATFRYLGSVFDLRFGWKAWLLPIVVLGAITSIAWKLPELWGEPHLDLRIPTLGALARLSLIMFFLAGGQEELGWRGYIVDPLEERFGPWFGNLALGVVWAVWHLPVFLIPSIGMDFTPPLAFLVLTIGLSWFFAWVREASGKRTFSGLYVHGLFNLLGSIFPTIVMASGTPQTRYWIWAGLIFTAGCIATCIRSSKSTKVSNYTAVA